VGGKKEERGGIGWEGKNGGGEGAEGEKGEGEEDRSVIKGEGGLEGNGSW